MDKMTNREMFDTYFKNGDEFLYVLDSMTRQHFKVHDIRPNQLEMTIYKISLPNQRLIFFYKVKYDIPNIYKVIQNFKR